jgi:hypothetical protein
MQHRCPHPERFRAGRLVRRLAAGAVGFNGAVAEVPDERLRLHVSNAAWLRWNPVNLVAVAAHLDGSGAAVA